LLPEHWPVQGTTGYDFLGISNGLFANSESEKRFTDLYSLVGKASSTERQIREKKASILYQSMNGEYENLTNLFYELDLHSAGTGATVDAVKKVISEFLIRCPVYRFYGNDFPVATEEAIAIQEVLDGIGTSKHLRPAVALLKDHLLIKPHDGNAEYNGRVRYFYQRLMQLAGPLMAKGVEDTFMYTYNRLLARNEVGDSPETFGHTTQQFHQKMIERQAHWPLSLNATSTHDTKRGEDVRARLNVLTDLAQDWSVNIGSWQTMNSAIRQKNAPDPNDEYSIYQLLIGHYSEEFDNAEFKERVLQYLEKALREAKVHSNWTDPGEHYENATKGFAMKLIDDRQGFRKSFCRLYGKVVDQSCLNSLAQVLLKFTCPGIPDVYQGCELFDLSFVDPDNRRAVDFQKRADWLNEIHRQQDEKRFIEGLWHNRQNEKVKLWLTNKLFQLRKKYNEVFAGGHYIPLQVRGKYKKNFLAYARRYRSHWIVAGVPLHLAAMAPKNATEEIWEDTRIVLPEEAPARWGNLFTYPETGSGREIYLREVLTGFPLLLLDLQSNQTDRGAGILLAVSSLPAPFGIGDFGPEAYAFADFLSRSKQKFWQILPLNPLEKEQGYSPYSSVSSMAGNTLLISPELMVADGLIDEGWCNARRVASKGNIDYENAEQIKRVLFQAGWERFKQGSFEQLEYAFTSFCRSEGRWLDDFALYRVLKRFNSNKPWYQWPKRFRLREPAGLHKFKASHSEAIELEKWLQFLFARQWMALKTYCNELNISIVGDLPFYVSYDSADVWTHQEIFALDKNGKILTQAGVPPDYFNSDGQLWGMPVFRWDILKDQKYDWWVRRIRKNIDFYDLLRLDHFRAFAFYWAVPGNADNARGGEWKAGPGADFFRNLEQQIGILPFLAEDLGSIDLPVYRLRDEFKLPGMKVLQFAFGNDAGESLNAPHHYTTNHFVYTGTHDNNTTLGWYLNDAGEHDIANIANYTGLRVNAKSIVSIFMRLAYASVAKVAILPMQDILRLDDTARMNTPASSNDNWLWQLMPGQIQPSMEKELRKWITIFSR
ncbi:MAG TPA: 4-alpha-glucanotransferase, partial [Sphingobacteriaceae bacterium]